jgi:glutaredoxin 3
MDNNNDDKQSQVTIYGTTWCGFCHTAKDYLNQKGVAYKYIDIEEDMNAANYIVLKTNQRGVPVIQVNNEFIVGFDKPKLNTLLKIS